ncbi:hypothetical protein D3C84_984170 [compost metagenome]
MSAAFLRGTATGNELLLPAFPWEYTVPVQHPPGWHVPPIAGRRTTTRPRPGDTETVVLRPIDSLRSV